MATRRRIPPPGRPKLKGASKKQWNKKIKKKPATKTQKQWNKKIKKK